MMNLLATVFVLGNTFPQVKNVMNCYDKVRTSVGDLNHFFLIFHNRLTYSVLLFVSLPFIDFKHSVLFMKTQDISDEFH